MEKTFKIFDDIILEKDFNNYELLIDKLMSNIKEQLTQNTQNQFDEIFNEIKKITEQNEKQIENNKSKADLKDEIENQVIEIKDMMKKDDQNLQNKFNEIGRKLKEIKEQLGIQDSKIEDNPEDEYSNQKEQNEIIEKKITNKKKKKKT